MSAKLHTGLRVIAWTVWAVSVVGFIGDMSGLSFFGTDYKIWGAAQLLALFLSLFIPQERTLTKG